MPKNRGADLLVNAFEKQAVTTIFTLSGNHIMPIFDAVIERHIRLIHTRHEAAAVHMADCFSRLTGKVGIAMVTGGPGHANAVSALYTALMAEAPVILLSGHAPNNQLGKGAFQEIRQADIAAPLCKASWTCAGSEFLSADFHLACQIALAGRPGPVHLSLPSDALENTFVGEESAQASPSAPKALNLHPLAPNTKITDEIISLLQQAKKPLILSGASAAHTHEARYQELGRLLQIPCIAMQSPRGIADPSLGSFTEIIEQADLVLLLNKRVDFTLKFAATPPFAKETRFIQLESDPEEIQRAKSALKERLVISSQADLLPSIEALIQTTQSKPATLLQDPNWYSSVQAAISYRPTSWKTAESKTPQRVHPANALLPLQAILDSHPDSILVADGGEIGQWAQACLHAPHRVLNGVAGSIGASIPFAVAAAITKPNVPVVAVLGDGTFGFHSAEFDTAVRHQAPFIAVIGNDACWNAEYQIQLREYGQERAKGCDLLPTRYDQVCVAFGGAGELVTQAEDVIPAAVRLQESQLPACLNILIEGLPAPNLKRPN
ncbi:MAG: thiamine pyrophosphate-binding protein [Polynucleobacter sp.]|nr:thiamine pyrophosphate-binding protein [Polynucleobacter sp.]